MTLFVVALFRSFDEKNEMDNDGDDKKEMHNYDASKYKKVLLEFYRDMSCYVKITRIVRYINRKYNIFLSEKDIFTVEISLRNSTPLTGRQLEAMKLQREKTKRCHRILKEILFSCICIAALYLAIFMDKNNLAYNYEAHIRQSFSEYKKVFLADHTHKKVL